MRTHGIPRPTYDVDFTLAVPRDRLDELFEVIADRGYTVPDQYVKGVGRYRGRHATREGSAVSRRRSIDADIFIVETPFQQEVITRRISADVEGHTVKLVSAEDLILFKLVASRPRDLLDIEDILFTQGELDETYLRQWAGPLGVEAKLDEVLASRE